MANANLTSITGANTFGVWRTRDNNSANTINELRNGNFYKDGGNIIVAAGTISLLLGSGTALQITADALIAGTLTLGGQIITGNSTIFGNVLMRSALNVAGPLLFNANDSQYMLNYNGDAVVNNLTVRGATTSVGNSTMVTDTIVLRSGLTTIGSAWINVNRGAANVNASLRWTEANGNWEIQNTGTGIYSTVLTSLNIADSFTSTSTSNAASANAAKNAYDHGTAAFDKANAASANALTAYGQANLAYAAANSAAGGGLATSGGTMTGNITFSGGSALVTPKFLGAVEGVNTNISVTQATYTANLSGNNVFDLTLKNANVAITFINSPTTGNSVSATVLLRQPSITANGFTISNTVKWSNGEIPVLSSGIANKLDILTFISVDGGTTFYGAHAMANIG